MGKMQTNGAGTPQIFRLLRNETMKERDNIFVVPDIVPTASERVITIRLE